MTRSLNHCRRFKVEKAPFSKYMIFQLYITIICSAMLLIHSLVIFVIEGDFSLPVPTCFSPLLFMFLWILF